MLLMKFPREVFRVRKGIFQPEYRISRENINFMKFFSLCSNFMVCGGLR